MPSEVAGNKPMPIQEPKTRLIPRGQNGTQTVNYSRYNMNTLEVDCGFAFLQPPFHPFPSHVWPPERAGLQVINN